MYLHSGNDTIHCWRIYSGCCVVCNSETDRIPQPTTRKCIMNSAPGLGLGAFGKHSRYPSRLQNYEKKNFPFANQPHYCEKADVCTCVDARIYLFMNSAPGLGLVLLEITQDEYEGRFSSASWREGCCLCTAIAR